MVNHSILPMKNLNITPRKSKKYFTCECCLNRIENKQTWSTLYIRALQKLALLFPLLLLLGGINTRRKQSGVAAMLNSRRLDEKNNNYKAKQFLEKVAHNNILNTFANRINRANSKKETQCAVRRGIRRLQIKKRSAVIHRPKLRLDCLKSLTTGDHDCLFFVL